MSRISHWWQQFQRSIEPSNSAAVARMRVEQVTQSAKRRGFWQQLYQTTNSLFTLNLADFMGVLRLVTQWSLLGGIIGVVAGTASAIFLTALAWATQVRLGQPWLLWLLPLAGLLMGWVYYQFGSTAAQGNNLVIDEVNRNHSRIPLRMAPLVLLGTIVTHLFGGSAGREGTAIQMGASLADGFQRLLRLSSTDRRMTIMAGISGGFGSVFGVPVAGAIFGMEVQSVGRIHYEGIVPCLVAAYVGDLVTRAWGTPHAHYPQLTNFPIEPWLLLKVAAAGIAFGLTSLLFVELTHGIKRIMALLTHWTPLHLLLGGFAIIGLTLLVGTRDYLSLSLPLIERSLDGSGVIAYAFLLKLLFTAVTLGTGYLGGEVTPLFVIGSTLGYTLGTFLGVDPTFLAAIGLVAVFAGASNTPLACAIMGVELFGGGGTLYLFLGCTVAYLASGHRGIYGTQRVSIPKVPGLEVLENENLRSLTARRPQGWLPSLARFKRTRLQKPVSTVMSAPVVTVSEEASAAQLVNAALAGGVRSVPIIDRQEHVVGIVTDRDLRRSGVNVTLGLLRQMTPQEQANVLVTLEQCPVRALMSQPVTTLAVTANLQEAADLLTQHELKHLPVVNPQGKLVGMVTRSDLLRELAFAEGPKPSGAAVTGVKTGANIEAKVQEIELLPAITVTQTTPLAQAIQMMRAAEQMRAVVIDKTGMTGRVVGIVTMTDLWMRVPAAERLTLLATLMGDTQSMHVLLSQEMLSQEVGDVMTSPVITISPESTVTEALHLLVENRIQQLPVVNAEGDMLGFVGRAELLRAFSATAMPTPQVA